MRTPQGPSPYRLCVLDSRSALPKAVACRKAVGRQVGTNHRDHGDAGAALPLVLPRAQPEEPRTQHTGLLRAQTRSSKHHRDGGKYGAGEARRLARKGTKIRSARRLALCTYNAGFESMSRVAARAGSACGRCQVTAHRHRAPSQPQAGRPYSASLRAPHFQLRTSGMSCPNRRMYRLCSMSLFCMCCLR